MSYLGIDIGTSGVKALLMDRSGKALGEATAKAVEPVRPHPGWSEQNPADWWNATIEAIDKLSKAHPAEIQIQSFSWGGSQQGGMGYGGGGGAGKINMHDVSITRRVMLMPL